VVEGFVIKYHWSTHKYLAIEPHHAASALYAESSLDIDRRLLLSVHTQQVATLQAQHRAEAEQRRRAEEAAVAAAHRTREAAQRWEQADQQAAAAEGESDKTWSRGANYPT